jgi:ABC-type sugar transport system ATPase subunit
VTELAARASGITKRFGGTTALDDVSFDVMPGEIHALVGENGAGKSTLIRVLGGVHGPDRGEIHVDGQACRFSSPREAIAAGIVTIPQELRLVPALSVAENMALGDLPVRKSFGLAVGLDRARMRRDARETLQVLDFFPNLDNPVRQLAFGERQLVAIGKALRRSCRVLILDEPTAALESHEIERLFGVLGRMREQAVAIVYISHRLDEIVSLADRCTILRDGRVVAVSRRGEFDVAALVQAMTGRITHDIHTETPSLADTLLEEPQNREDGMRLRAAEVVGLAGLLGSGKDRLLRRLFGVDIEPARVLIKGVPRQLSNPSQAVAAGIGMVPGERGLGLIMNQSVRDNILLASLDRLGSLQGFDRSAADRMVSTLMELLDIRPRQPELRVSALSGGNQQKVILAKWLAREVDILLLDDPTQGVDVAAKAQIHALVRDFAKRGGGVLLGSSDLAELARLCDTVVALHRGHVRARLERADGLSEQKLLGAIGG